MINITAKEVQNLRVMTGAPMMDCKLALVAAKGDLEIAKDWLRKKGLSQVDKKANREANEGLVGVCVSDNGVAIVEINCETDFVARNEKFQDFVRTTTQRVVDNRSFTADTAEIVAVLGENIKQGRYFVIDANSHESISTYIHGAAAEGVGKIGVAVLHTGDDDLGKKIAMHIAAMKPTAISIEQLDPEWVEKEKKLLTEQAIESGKPEHIVEKMVTGRMNKVLREVTLVNQPFVMNMEKTVGDLLKESDVRVVDFIRLEVGA
ncbi:hypothetical protein LCGC14_1943340 [marine sediment metagenome]|uniref:Translation elongation factor EFTs/EF1B dimerisation domain-containing protein n=1 Tax=marine sediment metagenome TaxID=412755 RepID=A0A0F9G852_9ZZZZ